MLFYCFELKVCAVSQRIFSRKASCIRRNSNAYFSASYAYRKRCPLGSSSSQTPRFVCDDEFIWILSVRRDTTVKSRGDVVCNEFLDESPDTWKDSPPPPPSNVPASFGKISPIEKGENVCLFQRWMLVQSRHIALISDTVTYPDM
jgi:hypothetical protein